jgi:glucosamine--fructose-6-phosphate aminotransferase (isomerizing)
MNKFLEEIFEQPATIEKTLVYFNTLAGKASLQSVKEANTNIGTEQIIFTGMGSSFFVSHAASSLFNELGIYSYALNAGELLHYNLSLLERKTLLVCISQSGESFEIREILKKLPSTVYCAGITNEKNSTLALSADIALLCLGGKEEMTSTKTYVLTSLVSFILGWYQAGNWNDDKMNMIKHLTGNIKKMLTNYRAWLTPILDFFGDIQTMQIIARGPAFSTASQSALMFKEAARIPAMGILGGEFRHGPMEMVSEGFKAILFAAKGKTLEQSFRMAEDIAGLDGRLLLITNEEKHMKNKKILPLFIDEPDEYLFSIAGIIPVQLFIDSYAKSKGFEAGSFLRGTKVTVIE